MVADEHVGSRLTEAETRALDFLRATPGLSAYAIAERLGVRRANGPECLERQRQRRLVVATARSRLGLDCCGGTTMTVPVAIVAASFPGTNRNIRVLYRFEYVGTGVTLPVFNFLSHVSESKKELVDQTWLRRIEQLQAIEKS